jgi:signal transduction histidine kinase
MDIDSSLARALVVLAAGLSASFALLGVHWWFAVRPALPDLGMLWPGAALLCLVIALAAQPASKHPRGAHLVGTALGLVSAGVSAVILAVTQEAGLAVTLYLTVLGFGLLLTSRLGLAVTVIASLAAWAWPASGGDPAWQPRGVALVACSLVAIAAQDMRLRLYSRINQSRQREMEAALQAQRAEGLRQDAEAKGAFLRLAAHELATPMTPITMQSRALATAKDLPSGLQRPAQVLDRNVQRLNLVLGRIITITQAQAGNLRLDRRSHDLAQVCKASVEAAAAKAAERRVEIRLDAQPLVAEVDEARMREVLDLLVENAIRFSPEGGRVRVQVRAHDGEARIAIEDQGPGISAQRLHSLFQPFGDEEGHTGGLGLALARHLLMAHGGDLAHENAPRSGSIFTVRIPLLPSQTTPLAASN